MGYLGNIRSGLGAVLARVEDYWDDGPANAKLLAAAPHLADTLEWVLVCLDRAVSEGSNAYDVELEAQAGWVTDMVDEITNALDDAGKGGK